jgi:glycosyltransferase involved in cell wall biosynthesis
MHVIGATVAGGAEKFVVELALEQLATGADVIIFALSSRCDSVGKMQESKLKAAGLPLFRGPTIKVGYRAVLRFRAAFNSFAPRIVHLHTPNTELVFALASIIGIRNAIKARTIHSTNIPKGRLYDWAYRQNSIQYSIACGEAVREKNPVPNTETLTIENGVNFDWPVQTAGLKKIEKEKLGLDDSRRHFVCVGSLKGASCEASPKGHDVLIQAWQAADMRRFADLHVLGEGQLGTELRAMSAADSSIHFHGLVSDVHSWLIACDGFVMPSRYEGLPIAAIEAMGTGISCVFSDIDALASLELSTTVRFRVNDKQELAKVLKSKTLFEDTPSLTEIEAFREQYGIKKTASRYNQYYSKLLEV